VPELKYFNAVREALAEEMDRDASTVLMGEDIGAAGGIYAEARGLQEQFGTERVLDTPAGELGFMGAAIGCAITGLRPIVEISFADFFPVCLDQLVNQAAKIRYMSGGQTSVPLTVFSFGGGGLGAGPQHSGTYEALLGSIPGLKVVTPARPGDAKGLLKSAIRDPDPTIVLLHKGLLQTREEVGDDADTTVPLGSAAVLREGGHITLVSWSGGVRLALAAAETLAGEGITAEVVDLRSVQPLDLDTVLASVRKTHRLLIVQETLGFAGIGSELAYAVGSAAFDFLDAPIERISPPFTPVPFSPPMEQFHTPSAAQVVERAKDMVSL
jgi:acetoin:2,6-dichlorophenolindophenol oxidoreductase subunit beta